MKMTLALMLSFVTASTYAMPGAEDKINCEAQAKRIVKTILQVQEGRSDIDVESTGNWGTKDGGEAGSIVWFDLKGIIVDKNGKKVKDLGQTYSEISLMNSKGSKICVMVGYELPEAN